MNIVVVGHVDHGKSTVVGRLLADTKSLPEGKLEQVKANCERNSKPFEYAFLIDALKDEQAQGITIDSARVFFKTPKRHYIIIDAPGHIEFLKNMITGAARAEAALLVIDANEGVRENSRRHGYMLSMLGIRQVAVLVNKMDLVNYDKKVFDRIVKEYRKFSKEIGLETNTFVPISARCGDMIASKTLALGWYQGAAVLDVLDDFQKQENMDNLPFRMPVQDVYKFTNFGDERRIVAGTVISGSLRIGDEVVFYPSGKKSVVKTIERFNAPVVHTAGATEAIGFTLAEQIYITRGEIAAKVQEDVPHVSSRIRVNLFWLGREPLTANKEYFLKLGTAKIPARLESVHKVIDASDLKISKSDSVRRHEIAECVFKLNRAMAFDLAQNIGETSRFVVVEQYQIVGGGIIVEALLDKQEKIRADVFLRNYKWIKSDIGIEQRSERYNQKPVLILVTGDKENVRRKEVARALERQLFQDGKFVYFMGIGSLIYGEDADIQGRQGVGEEHLRRLAEVVNLMLDAGVILIVSMAELIQQDFEIFKIVVGMDLIETVWVGDRESRDLFFDVKIPDNLRISEAVGRIKEDIQRKGVIFKPW